jgi:hypothetical protein
MLNIAFKEWAVVCEAIARGQQKLILRKGGIAEVGGEFVPEYSRFWLYPTYFHEQQQKGIKPEFMTLLEHTETTRPPAGQLHFTQVIQVESVAYLRDWAEVQKLDREHIWTEATIHQRFHYRTPGLYVLRITATTMDTLLLQELPEYAGCKTWVEL